MLLTANTADGPRVEGQRTPHGTVPAGTIDGGLEQERLVRAGAVLQSASR